MFVFYFVFVLCFVFALCHVCILFRFCIVLRFCIVSYFVLYFASYCVVLQLVGFQLLPAVSVEAVSCLCSIAPVVLLLPRVTSVKQPYHCLGQGELEEAMLASKLDAIAQEYNHLLVSQLESQRQYYEVGRHCLHGLKAMLQCAR